MYLFCSKVLFVTFTSISLPLFDIQMSNLERAVDSTGKRLDNLERTLSQCLNLLLKLQGGEDKHKKRQFIKRKLHVAVTPTDERRGTLRDYFLPSFTTLLRLCCCYNSYKTSYQHVFYSQISSFFSLQLSIRSLFERFLLLVPIAYKNKIQKTSLDSSHFFFLIFTYDNT